MSYGFPVRIIDQRQYQAGHYQRQGSAIVRRDYDVLERLWDEEAGRLYLVRDPEPEPEDAALASA